jgi:hypothetical protein
MFLLNKTILKIDKHRRRLFWTGRKKKTVYYMIKWKRDCRSRNKGGLVLQILDDSPRVAAAHFF